MCVCVCVLNAFFKKTVVIICREEIYINCTLISFTFRKWLGGESSEKVMKARYFRLFLQVYKYTSFREVFLKKSCYIVQRQSSDVKPAIKAAWFFPV